MAETKTAANYNNDNGPAIVIEDIYKSFGEKSA
jgi:phospholipid/cholesterol/gamma-HCH transport system ATP-binding protein